MHLGRPAYVSDLIVYLLHELGIEYVTLYRGATTEGPIVEPEALRSAIERGLRVVKEEKRLALIDTVTQPR